MKAIQFYFLSSTRQRTNEAGYSLIETMLAMAFLLIVMLSLAQGMLVSFGMNRNGRNNFQGLAIAQRVIEEVQNKYGRTLSDYNTLTVTATSNPPVTTNYTSTGETITGSSPAPTFVATQTVTVDPATPPTYKLVRISVTPQVRGFGPAQSVILETYIIKPE